MRAGVTVIGAQAFETGYAPSRVTTKQFNVSQCRPPIIQTKKLSRESRDGVVELILRSDPAEKATIYFSTRYKSKGVGQLVHPAIGGAPTGSKHDPMDDAPVIVPLLDDPVIVEAYCIRDGMLPSKLSSIECYPQKKVEMPQILVVPNLDEDELRIEATCDTPGANISYTLDGSDALSEDSFDYVRPVTIHIDDIGDNPDATIKVRVPCDK